MEHFEKTRTVPLPCERRISPVISHSKNDDESEYHPKERKKNERKTCGGAGPGIGRERDFRNRKFQRRFLGKNLGNVESQRHDRGRVQRQGNRSDCAGRIEDHGRSGLSAEQIDVFPAASADHAGEELHRFGLVQNQRNRPWRQSVDEFSRAERKGGVPEQRRLRDP